MKTATITSLAFGPLLECARAFQPALERKVRHAAAPLPEPLSLDTHRPVESYFDAWEALEHGVGPTRAVFGAQAATSLADLEVFGFLAMTAQNLGDAFRRIAAVRALWANGAGWSLDASASSVRLVYSTWPTSRKGGLLATEYMLADMVSSVREIVGQPVKPIAVTMAHTALSPLQAYEEFFGVAPLFGALESAVELDAGVGALSVRRFDTRLHEFFARECETIAARLSDADDWMAVARREIALAHRDEMPTADGIARALGLSPRSLRRRFATAGTTFRDVRQEVAVEMANAFLLRGLSAAETALAMGYAEPSSFSRAYKMWTGVSPRAFAQKPPEGHDG